MTDPPAQCGPVWVSPVCHLHPTPLLAYGESGAEALTFTSVVSPAFETGLPKAVVGGALFTGTSLSSGRSWLRLLFFSDSQLLLQQVPLVFDVHADRTHRFVERVGTGVDLSRLRD